MDTQRTFIQDSSKNIDVQKHFFKDRMKKFKGEKNPPSPSYERQAVEKVFGAIKLEVTPFKNACFFAE
ncbi:MAG: hypothetical protein LBS05_09095 [Tannerellaceae bacterium]|nr:hypothetical protein [Tannerellaceae bacterium]